MEPVDSNLQSSLTSIYEVFVLGGGLLALGFTIWRWPRWRATRRALGPWHLGWADFGLFLVSIVLLTVFAGIIGNALAHALTATPDDETPPIAVVAALSSLLMQGGFIVFFWQWRELHRSEAEGPIDSQPLRLGALLRFALLLVIASYPVIFLVSVGWQFALEGMKGLGLPIEIEMQEAVELFRDTDNLWVLSLLIFTAVFLAPIAEELVFRAGLYRFLLGRTSKPNAIVFSGLFFGLVHLNLFSFAPLAAFGILLCLAYDLTGNLKVPILMHMVFNANTVMVVLLFPETLTNPMKSPFTNTPDDQVASCGECGLLERIREWLGRAAPAAPAGDG